MKRLLAVALLGVTLAACDGGGDEQPPPVESPTATAGASASERLLRTRWVLVDVAGVPALPSPEATLEFPTLTQMQGFGTCNWFSGHVVISNGGVAVDSVQTTVRACLDDEISDQEQRYYQALSGAGRFTFDGDELLIHNDAFEAPLRFRSQVAATTGSGTWATLPDLPGGVRQETAVVTTPVPEEIVVIGGFGSDNSAQTRVEAYSPSTRQWRRLPDLPVGMHHANAAVINDAIWITGFLTGNNFAADGRVFVMRPGADSWGAGPSMPPGTQRGASAVAVIDQRIYVAGGLRGGAVTDFSVLDTESGRWEELPDLPLRRDHFVGGSFGTRVVLAGGREGNITSVTGRVDIFDTETNEWSEGAPMPTPRGGTSGAVMDGRLYVFGGEGNTAHASGVFPQAEAYEVATDTWQTLPPMPTPRHGTGAATLHGVIYIPGGATVQAYGAVATVESFTPDP